MSNIHTPERSINETFAAFKLRRAQHHAFNRSAIAKTCGGQKTSREIQRSHADHSKRIRTADALMSHFAQKRATGQITHTPV